MGSQRAAEKETRSGRKERRRERDRGGKRQRESGKRNEESFFLCVNERTKERNKTFLTRFLRQDGEDKVEASKRQKREGKLKHKKGGIVFGIAFECLCRHFKCVWPSRCTLNINK